MSGSNGLFNPSGEVTRAQVVTVLYRLAGSSEVTDYSACEELVDVESGKWYTDAVCWAYNTGVTTGDTTTKKFNMNTAVIRQQLASFFFRYADSMGYDTEERGNITYDLKPKATASRAQLATIIQRFCEANHL